MQRGRSDGTSRLGGIRKEVFTERVIQTEL